MTTLVAKKKNPKKGTAAMKKALKKSAHKRRDGAPSWPKTKLNAALAVQLCSCRKAGKEQVVREPCRPTAEPAQGRARLHRQRSKLQRAAVQFVAECELGRVLFSARRGAGAWSISGKSCMRSHSDGPGRVRNGGAAV